MTYPLRHISIRVPWHDTGWDGRVCAAPRPNSACLKFSRIAEDLGARVVGRRFLDDHAALPASHWPALEAEARRLCARAVVLTRKDAVKFPSLPACAAILDVATELVAGAPALDQALDAILTAPLGRHPPPRT